MLGLLHAGFFCFLSNSHLPAYLVAAFIKRLSRLALTAPPEALLMVIPFICNLFRRHPACKVLVHRPNGPEGKREGGRGVLCYTFRQHKEQDSCEGGGEIPAPVLRFRRIPLSLEFVESQQAAPASSLDCEDLPALLLSDLGPHSWLPCLCDSLSEGCFEPGTLTQPNAKC